MRDISMHFSVLVVFGAWQVRVAQEAAQEEAARKQEERGEAAAGTKQRKLQRWRSRRRRQLWKRKQLCGVLMHCWVVVRQTQRQKRPSK